MQYWVPRATLDNCRGHGANTGTNLVSMCNNWVIGSMIEDLRVAPAL
jgi:hypothetical protein